MRRNENGGMTTFTFVKATELPSNVPISTPLSFAFLDHRLLLVKKANGWWDIVGGKMEGGEDYLMALDREAEEEGGVQIHAHTLVGYVRAETKGDPGRFPPVSLLPVTYAHIKKMSHAFVPTREVLARDLVKLDEIEQYLSSREDAGQLLHMARYAFEQEGLVPYQHQFLYSPEVSADISNIPTTQAAALVRGADGKYYAVREKGSKKWLLPGGGCRLSEGGEACVRREILEEMGISDGALHSLGAIRVRVLNSQGMLLSESLHRRYLFETATVPVVPPKSEIEECAALSLDELVAHVEHLKNENGPKIRAAAEKLV